MTPTVQTQFELVTAKGLTVYTFDNEPRARQRLAERKAELPGAEIHRVVTTVVRERVYKPRAYARRGVGG